MRKTLITFFTIIFCLTSSAVWSKTLDDLIYRDKIYYKKFTEVIFSGEVRSIEQGLIKNGKREGFWVNYHSNGELKSKGEFKNGKKEGPWVKHYNNKQLKSKGNFKNGKKEGFRVKYYRSGQLKSKGNFKNGKKEGFWESYSSEGIIDKKI